MHFKIWKNKLGVSPIIATIVLISITIAAGLSTYALTSGIISTMSATLSIQVKSINIVQAGSNTLIAAAIENDGNIQINQCTLTVAGDSGAATMNLGAINPGQTSSASTSNPTGLTLTIGNAYTVKIEVTASNGNTLAEAQAAICTGS